MTAKVLVDKYGDGQNHTVASSILTKSGNVISSLNLYHFTGGPCAEVAALSKMVSEGEEPELIVAVGDGNSRGVLSPCGRCRQIFHDYYPQLKVVVPDGTTNKIVTIKELLPYTYSWNDQQESV